MKREQTYTKSDFDKCSIKKAFNGKDAYDELNNDTFYVILSALYYKGLLDTIEEYKNRLGDYNE